MTYYIKADKFFYPSQTKMGGFLEVNEGKFGRHLEAVPEAASVEDLTGYWIAPGLVDTHVHGFENRDVMDASPKVLETMSQGLLKQGVTSWLPTALTADHALLSRVCESIQQVMGNQSGAKIRGLFFEGPYFTATHKGAQNPAYMTDPDLEEFRRWNEACQGMIRKIALAPERPGAEAFIRALNEQGIAVAIGHSDASLKQALDAIDAGASIFVHGFNGMSAFGHREPGMVGAMLSTANTYAELICDGHHVHPRAAKILLQAKGAERTILITDAMRAAGMPDGDYLLGEFTVGVKAGVARLKEGGSLAGSILLLKDALKNIVDWGIATAEEAVMMATLTPAKSVGIEDCCGQIKEGHRADFIVLDKEMNLQEVYLEGEKVG
ncbi:N-acetylglucosamine-6-phosphate deacetylase [Lactococcus termiticola]|uniref:N-acetylglucosamine-6-phosphate deacetylase n=1 Tax=Lactococcus termiticola TaxID=2169526 RepID=A0A2R5HIU2_9LACT|nr:N-acetylglucosamine-6-phosphate deacetylase [Lactococcus termiticola]GBG96318.1 N-acetylglucosamine-6-phosphate deacetylase [Lactococcus termiticola]